MSEKEQNSFQPESNINPGRLRLAFLIGIVALVVLFVIGFLPRLHRNHDLTTEARAAGTAEPEVPVIKPTRAENADLALPGTTQAIEDAVVGARTTGYVSKRLVDIGSRVKAGDVLAYIESPDVDTQLLQANAQTSQAHAAVQQSKSDVINKMATVMQTKAAVRQAEANLEQAKAMQADAEAKLSQLQAAQSVSEAQLQQTQQQVGIKEAALQQAVTQRNLADLTLKRYQTLLAGGYVAAQDVDQNKATYENAVATVNSAQSDVNAAKANVNAAEQTVKSAKANVRSGQAQVRAAEKNVKAVAATVGSSQAAVEAAQANVQSSKSTVQANQYTERANRANGEHYKVLTSFEKVVAPFAGVITARNVDVGSLVGSGSGGAASSSPTSSTTSSGSVSNAGSATTATSTPNTTPGGGLFGLARTDTLRILVSVPQTFARQMHPGLATKLVFAEYPDKPFLGTVAYISGALDVTSRTLLTEIHIDNRNGALLPGMYAQVHFDLPRTTGAVRVPASTVIFDALGTRVATVAKDNTLHFVNVKIGRDYGQELEIIRGLTGNETLAYSPSDDLIEGEKVKPTAPPQTTGSAPASPGQQGTAPKSSGQTQPSTGAKPGG